MTGNSVRRLVRGAIPALTTNPPNLAEIQHLMSLVTPEDLHFDWGLVSRAGYLGRMCLYTKVSPILMSL